MLLLILLCTEVWEWPVLSKRGRALTGFSSVARWALPAMTIISSFVVQVSEREMISQSADSPVTDAAVSSSHNGPLTSGTSKQRHVASTWSHDTKGKLSQSVCGENNLSGWTWRICCKHLSCICISIPFSGCLESMSWGVSSFSWCMTAKRNKSCLQQNQNIFLSQSTVLSDTQDTSPQLSEDLLSSQSELRSSKCPQDRELPSLPPGSAPTEDRPPASGDSTYEVSV